MTTQEPASWREQAVARSLSSARSRAEHRVQRFLDAATELMEASEDGKEFTVQEVVERSGQSLRSFYQYFGGKHELLLALFEETVRDTAERLTEVVAEVDDPAERVHRLVVELYRMCSPAPNKKGKRTPVTPVLVDFAQQLLTSHPAEAAKAFAPLAQLFRQTLDEAAGAGVLRPDIQRDRLAGILLETIMFNAFSATIGGSPMRAGGDAAEELWELFFRGMAAPSA